VTTPRLTHRVIMDRAQCQQLLGEYLQIQLIGFSYRLHRIKWPQVHPMTGAGDRSSHRSNRVAIAAE